jgi:hypothetical protein
MKTRVAVLAALGAAVALATGAFALAGGGGLIFDDGHYVKPGSLDDGKQLLPQTRISVAQAVVAAKGAADGAVGQVDLESSGGRVVYVVDIGRREVGIDAVDGSLAGVAPRH